MHFERKLTFSATPDVIGEGDIKLKAVISFIPFFSVEPSLAQSPDVKIDLQ